LARERRGTRCRRSPHTPAHKAPRPRDSARPTTLRLPSRRREAPAASGSPGFGRPSSLVTGRIRGTAGSRRLALAVGGLALAGLASGLLRRSASLHGRSGLGRRVEGCRGILHVVAAVVVTVTVTVTVTVSGVRRCRCLVHR